MSDFITPGAWLGGIILFFLLFKKLKGLIREVYGTIDKVEFAGFLFTIVLFWMIYKEGTRPHQWHIFNDTYILIIAGASLTGLGLRTVFKGMKELQLAKNEGDEEEKPKKPIDETPRDEPLP